MVNSCCVKDCHSRADREKDLSFFRIPKVISNQGEHCQNLSDARRRQWLANIGQNMEGKKIDALRVCSRHFLNGKPSMLYDQGNPDWVPTLDMGTKKPETPAAKNSDRYSRNKMRSEKKKLFEFENSQLSSVLEFEEEVATRQAASSQTDVTTSFLGMLEVEMRRLQLEVDRLKLQLEDKSITLESFRDNSEKVKFYTGLPTFVLLQFIFSVLEPYLPVKVNFSKDKLLILTLMKLRLNLSFQDLAYRFNISTSTVSRYFCETIDVMNTYLQHLIHWPTRDSLKKTTPMEFRKSFGTKTVVIIDCFEVFIDRPSNLEARYQTWSSYKHHNTVKYLIGITPQGTISFISEGWGGRVSDKHLTENSGLLDKLLPGDLILADRGFDIHESVGVTCPYAEVKIPAFTKGKNQLSPIDVETTRKIAHVRIHVERVIGSVRQKFTILNGPIPIDFLMCKKGEDIPVIDKICRVVCCLINLCPSIVDFE